MYILQCSVILFLLGIFRGTYESTCSTGHNWEVAEFCQTNRSTGNTVILDGYGVYNNGSPEKKCKCTAIISIPNNGSSTIVFNKLHTQLQPGYIGCGSHISIQGSGQSLIQRCYIAGTMSVKNQEHLDIELVKDQHPKDTRYCMKIHIEDLAASLKVTCYSQTATTPSQSSVMSPAITSTVKIEDTTSTALPSTDTPEEDITKQSSVTTLSSPTSYNTTSRPHISTTAIATENVTTNTVPSDIPKTTSSKFTNTTLTHISTSKQSQATSSVTLDDIPIESTSTDKTVTDTHAASSVTDTTPLVTHTASNATLTTSPIAQSESTVTHTSSHVTQTTSPVAHTSSTVTRTTSNGTQGESSVTTSSEAKPTSSVTYTTSPDIHTTHTVSFQTTPSSTQTTTQSDGITTSNAPVGDSTTTRDAHTTKLATPITQQTSISESSSQSIAMTSIQNSTTTQTTKDPSVGGTSSDKDLPIEVVIPIAFVGGLLLIFLIICVFVGLRRNVCGCDDELVLQNNNLVDKVSVDIKNREKDTYVNPLYDDISLTGKSDRSDKDSMMQEIQSDDEDYTVDSYHIPVSTEIDGELWTHL